ncbi:TonB-dependent receptor [Thermoflavifilum thermophilum]|uniref:Outer membrane receptor proteins, mostly Fe transport n=1 Tax=Thermoflavifilum thermophilum TaxID=1393122 RepID=A0A1I7NE74_9BACT|nr:TonB-dependent receptor [Thermoflavifilum thermophilum]SFV32846.1 Outer membrane receptor proteins, mostly Fe transport [Thermoflavifilum thermophilum]
MKKFFITMVVLLLSLGELWAQQVSVSGSLQDGQTKTPLIGATVVLIPQQDTSRKLFGITDAQGHFQIGNLTNGNYRLNISYLGYQSLQRSISIEKNQSLNVGVLYLQPTKTMLQEVKVVGQVPPSQMKGDTVEYNAQAYKTNPNATAEDLVGKMPGIIVNSDGSVTAHGETVQKVLVDGKPFFGDDPTTALRNLPAEIVDKVEVFDKMSDQAQFTGFDDGNTQKTINIVTRADRRNGQFGKLYAGYGTDSRYSLGGNINFFNGDRRISLIGMSNNVNQQNFAFQDLLGVTGGGGGFGGGRGGGYRGAGGIGNFLVGQQNGIVTTNSIGLNYSDDWGKKITVTGSYFFNTSHNNNQQTIDRTYFVSQNANQLYHENDLSSSTNYNHRFNLRMEYQINDKNSLIFTPSFNTQEYNGSSTVAGAYYTPDSVMISQTNTQRNSHNTGYNFSDNLLWRHAFNKKGRTLSVNLSTSLSEKNATNLLLANNSYFKDPSNLFDTTNQQSVLHSHTQQIGTTLDYTEPIGQKSQLLLTYNTSYTTGESDKNTYQFDPLKQQYTNLDTGLTNNYKSYYTANQFGASYRYRANNNLFFTAGLSYQIANLEGDRTFPMNTIIKRNFYNLLGNAMMRYRIGNTRNLRVFFRTSTNAPSISQLQDVVDNSNPLQLTTGNPDLKQETTQSLFVRYSAVNTDKNKMFFAFLGVQQTQNNITNATITATQDSVLAHGVILNKGSQLTYPVNLNGYWSIRSFATLGLPLKFMKSNLNLSGGINFSRTPGLVNNQKNYANNFGVTFPIVISSNISENLDFTLSYTPNYNIVKNSIQPNLNSNYFSNAASARINWIFWKGFELDNNITYQKYSGLGETYDKPYLLWNASIGKHFFKNQNGELQLTVFDLLKQNRSINRNVTETYIENSTTSVLQQYFLLTFTYNLRNFKGAVPQQSPRDRMFMFPGMRPPGGGPPPGGGMMHPPED